MHSDVPEIKESSLTNTWYLPNKGGLPKADAWVSLALWEFEGI